MELATLSEEPFKLLVELERLARAAVAKREGGEGIEGEWVGVGFRIGGEQFVAPRVQVREVLPLPENLTRVPGAKSWLRGIANVRGHLLPVTDVRAFVGSGNVANDRAARVLVVNHREIPAGLLVDEVSGFRRFGVEQFEESAPATVVRCEHYLDGVYRHSDESWPVFNLEKLVEDEVFLRAGE